MHKEEEETAKSCDFCFWMFASVELTLMAGQMNFTDAVGCEMSGKGRVGGGGWRKKERETEKKERRRRGKRREGERCTSQIFHE